MGLFDINYNFDNLVRMTSAGPEVSSFVQIKNALIKRYKEIYGNDIDVDTTSADGQYMMMLSLLLYNGYNGLLFLNKNLDPASASGKFLNVLCGLNNVFRKNASNSYAYLYVKYIGSPTGPDGTYAFNNSSNIQTIQCMDQSGRIWTWKEGGNVDNSFKTKFYSENEGKPIPCLKFVCEESGAIEAKSDLNMNDLNAISYSILTKDNHGDISQTIDLNTFPFEVWQAKDAVVGNEQETDEALRQRMQYERGNAGITVANSLLGRVLNIVGVMEAKLYNNNYEPSGAIANDGTTINFHDVYIALRYQENCEVDKNLIGTTIDEQLTPGIVTTQYTDTDRVYGEGQSITINAYETIIEYPIYWKKCLPISPSMQLKFKVRKSTYIKKEKEESIVDCFKKYLFDLSIYDDINVPEIISKLNVNDVMVNNQHTYMFYQGLVEALLSQQKIDTSDRTYGSIFTNKDTYYSYNDYSIEYGSVTVTSTNFADLVATGKLYTFSYSDGYVPVSSSATYNSSNNYCLLSDNKLVFEFTYSQESETAPYLEGTLDIYNKQS